MGHSGGIEEGNIERAATPAAPAASTNAGQPECTVAAPSVPARTPSVAQAVLLSSTIGQLLIALLITTYLARILSPAAFGFFSLVGTIFILARKFLDLGLGNVAARDVARTPSRERPILEGMIAYRRVAGPVMAAAVCIFALMQAAAPERAVLFAAAAVLLFTEPAALDPVFQVRQAQGGPALINLMAGLLVLGGSFFFKQIGIAGAAFGCLLVVREAFILLLTKLLGERLLGYRPRPGFRGRNLREFAGPALTFGLASLVYTVYFHGDVFFVYALRSSDELGAYAAAFRPINPLLLLPWLLMVPLVPVLSAAAAQDGELFVRQVRGACGIALGIGACAAVGGLLLAPDFVQLLYKDRYLHGDLSCVNAFRWLAIAAGEVCVTTVLTASLLAAKKERLLLTIGVAALVANAAMNLILLRHHNFTAAGFATAATELLFLVAALLAFYAVTRSSAWSQTSVLNLLPAILLGGVLRFANGTPVLRVSVGILGGVLAAGIILFTPAARRFRREIASSFESARDLQPVSIEP